MPIDNTLVGETAAELMDRIEDNYGDQGRVAQDGRLVSVALIAAVEHSSGTQTTYDYSFRPPAAAHEAIGLLEVALNTIATRLPRYPN